jgi:phosphatidylglycerophosphatase C
MGMPIIEHHRSKSARLTRSGPIVAFDFDGTLTVSDTFLAFLRWREGNAGYYAGMAKLAPAASAFLVNRKVDRLKAAAVKTFLRGLPMEMLQEEAREFAGTATPSLLRPDALRVWRRHRNDGARMVIVTASPEPIIAPFARGLGADLLIGTGLAVDRDGYLTGGLKGRNCRGPEKVKRLREAFGEDVRLAAAYGDTEGDDDMLDIADEKFMRLFVGDPLKGRGPL